MILILVLTLVILSTLGFTILRMFDIIDSVDYIGITIILLGMVYSIGLLILLLGG